MHHPDQTSLPPVGHRADAVDDGHDSDNPTGTAGRRLVRISQGLALGGGLIFLMLIGMSIVSIVGRKLLAAPIQGDVELLQMGAAVGAAAFLPYCEIRDHHIKVDAFSGWLPHRAQTALDAIAHFALAIMASLLTWRTALQALDTHSSGEISTLLSVPLWIPIALLVPSFMLLAMNAAYRATLSASHVNRGSQ